MSRPATLLAALAFVGIPLTGQTDPHKGLDPYLGTWSGLFTTQDNEFWGAEDYVCFPGCARETREFMISLLDDPANDALPVGALLGQAFGFAAAHLTTILTPAGKQIQDANDIVNDPKLHCQPYGFVREVTNPLPMSWRRNGDHLLIEYEEWGLLRTIYLDGRAHPTLATPSMLGHSVGRIEDGVLIVETARMTPDWISDNTEGGHSGELTGVERYTIRENPRRLELEFTLEDPVTLAEPYVILKTWLYTPDFKHPQTRYIYLPD